MPDLLYPNQMAGMPACSRDGWGSPPLSYDHLYNYTYPTPALSQASTAYNTPQGPTAGSSPYQSFTPNLQPRSSPQSFSRNVEDLIYTGNPLRIQHEAVEEASYENSPNLSARHESPQMYGTFGVSKLDPHAAPKKWVPVPIAPHPAGLEQINNLKRYRDDEESASSPPKRRKRAESNPSSVELSEEEKLLLKLKDEEFLPWKDIALRFQVELGKVFQVPALQMRYKRLRERLRTWTEIDIRALQQAHEYWEKFKFDIIGAKMLDFGAVEKWPAKYCARKWEELHGVPDDAKSETSTSTKDRQESYHDSPDHFSVPDV
ncbi:MAG: hypothetical protein M1819_004091 [Sarea resinae]|nr:MAG: hypothetical protein M1819_004091 [Sarea resinae]